MSMQTLGLQAPRLGKFKGQILAHAVPREILAKQGRQVKMPKNNSDTYVSRRWLPYGATASQPNLFVQAGTGDRANAYVQQHLTTEGVTGLPDSITAQDVTVVIQQYSCLYGFTDKTFDLYEDDVPGAMAEIVGERVALVNEYINWGVVRTTTNAFYGGTGTSRATVNGAITLGMVRKIAKSLMANHADMVSSMLSASPDYDTSAVSAGFFVYCSTDMEPDIRDLPGFVPVEKYASGKPMPYEIGKCERFRFIASPEFVAIQDAGAAVGATGLYSTSGSNIDVYQFIVTAKDAWSQVAVRGKEALKPTMIMPNEITKSDPHGQRGYIGTIWYKAAQIENSGWISVGNVGVKNLT